MRKRERECKMMDLMLSNYIRKTDNSPEPILSSRTREVVQNKGSKESFLGSGTWEGAEKKAFVGNVRKNFSSDEMSDFLSADFQSFSIAATLKTSTKYDI